MTRREIEKQYSALQREAELNREARSEVLQKLRELRQQCKHRASYATSKRGKIIQRCPDCGWEG